VGQIVTRSGRFEGVVTDQGRIGADACVVATGPWLQELLPAAPVFAGRGWLLRTAVLPFELPWVLAEMAWPDLDALGRASRPPTLAEVAAGGYDRPVAATVAVVGMPGGDAGDGALAGGPDRGRKAGAGAGAAAARPVFVSAGGRGVARPYDSAVGASGGISAPIA